MRLQTLPGLTLLLCAWPALAAPPAPDLSVALQPPGPTQVYAPATYGVTVSNIGRRDAASVSLTIQLPTTGTSPQVYIMGTLGARDSRCSGGTNNGTAAGTRLVCSLGNLRRSTSTQVSFDIELPEKTGALTFVATASTTTTPETNPGNNTATHDASLTYYANSVFLDQDATNDHCTGTGLTAYFECTKFPGSISQHLTQFHGGPTSGTLSFPGNPGYGGTWDLNGPVLTFSYTDPGNANVAGFSGRGVPGGCFEGLTTFPGSPYVAPYKVCFP